MKHIFLNLKLRDRAEQESRVKIAVVECNPENLSHMADQLRTIPHTDIYAYLAESIEEYPYKLAEDLDLVVTTAAHADFLEGVLPERRRMARVALRLTKHCLADIIKLRKGKTVGILCYSMRFGHLLHTTCQTYTDGVNLSEPVDFSAELDMEAFLDGKDAVLSQIAIHMDEILGDIGVLLLVHSAVRADEVAGLGVGKHIHHDGLVAPVDIFLGALAHIDVGEAARTALYRKERIENEGILAMIVPAALRVLRFILSCKEDRVIDVLAEVQHGFPVLVLLVVPVNHSALIRGVHGVIVDILAEIRRSASQLTCQFRIPVLQQIIVHQLHMEQVAGLLDVSNAAFPEQVDDIHLSDSNVTHAIHGSLIPETVHDFFLFSSQFLHVIIC
mgnify:CR=1 FL=1